jgi:hypothetical protein
VTEKASLFLDILGLVAVAAGIVGGLWAFVGAWALCAGGAVIFTGSWLSTRSPRPVGNEPS